MSVGTISSIILMNIAIGLIEAFTKDSFQEPAETMFEYERYDLPIYSSIESVAKWDILYIQLKD